jgi:hypothetical protein
MDVWVDGAVVESRGEFMDGGTETHFTLAGQEAVIETIAEGTKIVQVLFVNELEYPECMDKRREA